MLSDHYLKQIFQLCTSHPWHSTHQNSFSNLSESIWNKARNKSRSSSAPFSSVRDHSSTDGHCYQMQFDSYKLFGLTPSRFVSNPRCVFSISRKCLFLSGSSNGLRNGFGQEMLLASYFPVGPLEKLFSFWISLLVYETFVIY